MCPVFINDVDTVYSIGGRGSCILRANVNMPMALFEKKKKNY